MMIRTFVKTKLNDFVVDMPIENLASDDVAWYWVDIDSPTEEESAILKTRFNFHHLAIEDCLHVLQRPKLDYYDGYDFYVLHSLDQAMLSPIEVDAFVGPNYIVTFHLLPVPEIGVVAERLAGQTQLATGPLFVFYHLLDKIVDAYFPIFYGIEDSLNDIANQEIDGIVVTEVYKIRSQLLRLRRTILPMNELLYRMLNSSKLNIQNEHHVYFKDIYDHLLKLTDIIESNREMTADIRDSYISLNSNRANMIMKTLTVVTSVFIPLTFIASIYGMNFVHIPELSWRWGYFTCLGVMGVVGAFMIWWLWRKGWFE